jgi:hypothetical protein
MKIALLSLAVMVGQTTIPVSDRVPQFNVEALCKASVAADKAMGLDLPQSYDDCMRDENNALRHSMLSGSKILMRFETDVKARRLPSVMTATSIC